MTKLQKELFALQDPSYKAFHQKLMPETDPDTIIGIRTPVLRKFARSFAKTDAASAFLQALPHRYYEENNLHAFVLETEKDFERALSETERFLPYIDNWATCDCFCPKVFAKNAERLLPKITCWICSDHTYTVRYAIGLLMRFFLDENFDVRYLDAVAAVRSEAYYVNMMRAWFFATALAKQYDATLPYLTGERLDAWTHNKTIQKAIESNRIDSDQKAFFRTLRRKSE